MGSKKVANMVVSQVRQCLLNISNANYFCMKENHQEREKARASQEGENKDLGRGDGEGNIQGGQGDTGQIRRQISPSRSETLARYVRSVQAKSRRRQPTQKVGIVVNSHYSESSLNAPQETPG